MHRPARRAVTVAASLVAGVALVAGPTIAQTPAPSPRPPLLPTIDLSTVGGPGEGALNLIIWAGYAEDGTNVPEYDWVHPFEAATGCVVTTKPDDTSDQMVTDLRSGGGATYDGLSASGDATLRLINAGDVAEIDTSTIPGFSDVAPFLQNAPYNVVDGKHYGVPHGWGGNVLMYNTEKVTPAPTSWDIVFDPAKAKDYDQLITIYKSPIYIADAALYLKAHRPDLGITDIYELTQPQLDAAAQLLTDQKPFVGKAWDLWADELDNFSSGASVVGTAWPYQVNALKASGLPIAAVVPSEGMTGWADTWMMSSKAQHPNCMKKWMAWMLSPEIQTQVAESYGEAPANPKACAYLDVGYGPYAFPGFCDKFSVNDKSFYDSIAYWKTPLADCGDSRGQTCMDYDAWTAKWVDVRGS